MTEKTRTSILSSISVRAIFHLAVLLLMAASWPAPILAEGPSYTNPNEAGRDFRYQGEYVGTVEGENREIRLGTQVIALGKGTFRAVAFMGGLPGDGWDGSQKREIEGKLEGALVVFRGERSDGQVTEDGKLRIVSKAGDVRGTLEKVDRRSKSLGKKPPPGAIVLFDGSTAEHFIGGKVSDDGFLMPGVTSKQRFQDHDLHVEFRLPFQPENRGQKRGNSGIYVQGRYEIQMLDSFGLAGEDNECGGIYTIKAPDVNVCFPPLSWQTYDIQFKAARYDSGGQLLHKPRLTVRHNGVMIHDDVELPDDAPTRAAPLKAGAGPGPVYLQNHGDPVRYRNIWAVPK